MVAKKQIYIYGLGYRNPITEKEQITWFFDQNAKQHPPKFKFSYWNQLMNEFGNIFLKLEAFEVYAHIKNNLDDKKVKKARKDKVKSMQKARLEMDNLKKWVDQRKLRIDLVKLIVFN